MKVLYTEPDGKRFFLEPEGMIYCISKLIRDAVKFEKELTFSIFIKKEKKEKEKEKGNER